MWFKKKAKELPKDYFTQEWMEEWEESINTSEDYKNKGRNWNAPLVLKIDPAPDHFKKEAVIGFFLHLQYGKCTEMKFAKRQDLDRCDIVLSADQKNWVKLIEEKRDPVMMIMNGKLNLEKGSLILLSTQRQAAKSLLNTAPVYSYAPISAELKESLQEPPSIRREHTGFVTTRSGLDFDSFPMQLFQKVKIAGVWNPADIGFSKDREQWHTFSEKEITILIHLCSLLMAGEEAATLDLLPLIQTISKEGRIEEVLFLTSILWEEARHTEFFSRFVSEVMVVRPDFEVFHSTFYKKIFYQKLPSHLNTLYTDISPLAQLKAAGTYCIIVKGTLAETGYKACHTMLTETNLLPGLQQGITKLQQDESRHMAYGQYLINRILDENPGLKTQFEDHLKELLNDATNVIHELFEPYDVVPFGLEKDWFLTYALKQFQQRMEKLGL